MRLSSLQSANYQSRQRELDEPLFHFCVVIDLALSENGNPLSPPAIGRWLEPTSISDTVMHLSTCATSMGLSREPVTSK